MIGSLVDIFSPAPRLLRRLDPLAQFVLGASQAEGYRVRVDPDRFIGAYHLVDRIPNFNVAPVRIAIGADPKRVHLLGELGLAQA